MSQDRIIQRLERLTEEIHDHPHVAVNYLLRAEVYAQYGYWEQAMVDSERAYELAHNELMGRQWGFVAQSVQDRAQRLMTKARRYTK
ncbi:MAG: hypothetical protein SH821_14295 [Phototrophicales bacterium]|nr:hypothetical protein [Phototrophicales bacterium]